MIENIERGNKNLTVLTVALCL